MLTRLFVRRLRHAAAFASLAVVAALGSLTRAQAPVAPLARGQVDVQRSRAFVRVEATGLGHVHGVEGRLTAGTINLGAPQQAGELVFDMNSFICDTPVSRNYVSVEGTIDTPTQKKTTANMLGAEVLDIARFPQARFAIRSALPLAKRQPTDPQWFQLDGDFTLHGVTRPLRINVVSEPADGVIHLRGQFAIRQTEFGIKPYSRALGAVGVGDELKIWGDLWIGAM